MSGNGSDPSFAWLWLLDAAARIGLIAGHTMDHAYSDLNGPVSIAPPW
jgi:hypothetical protein